MKKRSSAILYLIIGLLAIGFGVFSLMRTDIDCGGDAMQPGDTCEVTSKTGTKSELSYDEQKSSQERTGYIALGVGVLVLGYSGWTLRSASKKAEPPAVPAA